jgi:hypothetical protein
MPGRTFVMNNTMSTVDTKADFPYVLGISRPDFYTGFLRLNFCA